MKWAILFGGLAGTVLLIGHGDDAWFRLTTVIRRRSYLTFLRRTRRTM